MKKCCVKISLRARGSFLAVILLCAMLVSCASFNATGTASLSTTRTTAVTSPLGTPSTAKEEGQALPWSLPENRLAGYPNILTLAQEKRLQEDRELLRQSDEYLQADHWQESLDYFHDIAMSSEYSQSKRLHRWKDKLRIRVSGSLSDEDLFTLCRHIAFLNQIEGFPGAEIVGTGANMDFHFVSLSAMSQVIPSYVSDNYGFMTCQLNASDVIYQSSIAIAIDVTDQSTRNHLILEEFTQALGLANDSYQYPESIFQQAWTYVQNLSPLDIALLRMLYSKALRPGMTAAAAESALRSHYLK